MNSNIKILLNELKPHKYKILLVFIFGGIAALLKILVPEILRRLTDDAWVNADKQLAITLPILLAVIWIIISILRYFTAYPIKLIAEKVSIKLRKNLMNKYLDLNLSFCINLCKDLADLSVVC